MCHSHLDLKQKAVVVCHSHLDFKQKAVVDSLGLGVLDFKIGVS